MPFFVVGNRDWELGEYEAEDAEDAIEQAREEHPSHAHRALHARAYAWGFSANAITVEMMRRDGTWDRLSEAQKDRWYLDGPRIRRRTMREAWKAWAATQGLALAFVGETGRPKQVSSTRKTTTGKTWYDPLGADMYDVRRIWLSQEADDAYWARKEVEVRRLYDAER